MNIKRITEWCLSRLVVLLLGVGLIMVIVNIVGFILFAVGLILHEN